MKLSELLFQDFIYNGFAMENVHYIWDYQCWEVIQL